MSFLETPRFPTSIALKSRGGPVYSTSIVEKKSGREQRNANWSNCLIRYDVGYGVREMEDLADLIDFFHVVGGREHGFRFKDPMDYKSCKIYQTLDIDNNVSFLGYSDGTTTVQLRKRYDEGNLDVTYRDITKPVDNGTIIVKVEGDELVEGVGFTVDYTTGIITLTDAPNVNDRIWAVFEFDVPMRFESDSLPVTMEAYNLAATQVFVTGIREQT